MMAAKAERIRSIDAIGRHIVGLTMGNFGSEEQFDLLLKDSCKPPYKLADVEIEAVIMCGNEGS